MQLETFLRLSNLTAAKFAKEIGVSRVTVGRYLSGDRVPRKKVMQKIQEVTDGAVQPNDFFAGRGCSSSPGVTNASTQEASL